MKALKPPEDLDHPRAAEKTPRFKFAIDLATGKSGDKTSESTLVEEVASEEGEKSE